MVLLLIAVWGQVLMEPSPLSQLHTRVIRPVPFRCLSFRTSAASCPLGAFHRGSASVLPLRHASSHSCLRRSWFSRFCSAAHSSP
jgi:hypothetical protein